MKRFTGPFLALSLLTLVGCPGPTPQPVLESLGLRAYEDGYAIHMSDDQGGSDEFTVLPGPGCSFKVPAGGDLALQPYADMWKSELLVESELAGTQSLEIVCFPGTLSLGTKQLSNEGACFSARPGSESLPVPVVILPTARLLKVDPAAPPTLTIETWEGELASGESFVLYTYTSSADERIEVLPVVAGKAHMIEAGASSGWVRQNVHSERSFIYRPLTRVELTFKDDVASGSHDSEALVLRRTSSQPWTYGVETPQTEGGN
jgi:hypothetical protein